MRWFKLTVDTFESTTNPPNGSFVVMARKEGPQIHVRMFDGPVAFSGPSTDPSKLCPFLLARLTI